jgi:pyruvate dehydrogenase E2 component (dihydrolipoamide acetyltransferase)
MAIPVIMPKQGQSVETCIITSWLKKKGEKVQIGDILFSYETDKAAFDFESVAEGTILDIFFDEGSEVPVHENVAVIGTPGEETEPFRPGKSAMGGVAKNVSAKSADKVNASALVNAEEVRPEDDDRIRISPRAKTFAVSKKLNYNNLSGTGPNGRIILKDIENALKKLKITQVAGNPSPLTGFTEQPLTNVRKLIAKAMYSSLQNSAQLTHHMSADVHHLLEARKQIKSELLKNKNAQDITLNDMICWCVIKALKKFPEANSHFMGEKIKTFFRVDLGFAVDTSRGLMVPVVRNADEMSLFKLSQELKTAAEACKKGNISPELIKSDAASFTVSNLGNYGVEMFTPVVNLPQVGILGVCTITYRPADLGNGIFGFVPFIGLSLTYDHRAIDGGPATQFLREIKNQIENFKYEETR